MATIHTRIESSRGCGFRKEGGFYLVIDGKGIECGLLPINLPEHIKTSRAPQWKTVGEAFGKSQERKCSAPKCHQCWLKSMPDNTMALVNFVGMAHYRTVEQFERESGRQGISRRIPPHIIRNIRVGETPVLLAHRESSKILDGDSVTTIRQIFAAFKPQRIEYIITGKETEAELNSLESQGITLIRVKKAGKLLYLGFESN